MKPWTTRAILLSVLTAWLLSGADLSNTVEDSEEQEGALENTRALEAEDSGDSDAELDSDGLKGERELEAEDSGDSDAELDSDGLKGERELVDSEVVLTQSMVVKKDALSKRYYRIEGIKLTRGFPYQGLVTMTKVIFMRGVTLLKEWIFWFGLVHGSKDSPHRVYRFVTERLP
ncbi:UNVERIFIED_CONTAM: hypothetical protein FKN15_028995 [Acipenser sinensis]